MAYTPDDLRMVDDHIAQGERHIIRQEELVSRLRSRGMPTEAAEELLEEFRALLHQHWEHRALMVEDMEGGRA